MVWSIPHRGRAAQASVDHQEVSYGWGDGVADQRDVSDTRWSYAFGKCISEIRKGMWAWLTTDLPRTRGSYILTLTILFFLFFLKLGQLVGICDTVTLYTTFPLSLLPTLFPFDTNVSPSDIPFPFSLIHFPNGTDEQSPQPHSVRCSQRRSFYPTTRVLCYPYSRAERGVLHPSSKTRRAGFGSPSQHQTLRADPRGVEAQRLWDSRGAGMSDGW